MKPRVRHPFYTRATHPNFFFLGVLPCANKPFFAEQPPPPPTPPPNPPPHPPPLALRLLPSSSLGPSLGNHPIYFPPPPCGASYYSEFEFSIAGRGFLIASSTAVAFSVFSRAPCLLCIPTLLMAPHVRPFLSVPSLKRGCPSLRCASALTETL